MTEHQYRELLGPYVLGELSAEEVRELEHHLAECSECQEELEDVQLGHERLRQFAAVSPPLELKAQVLPQEPASASSYRNRWRTWVPAAVLVVAAFVGSALFLAIGGSSGEPTPLTSTDLAPDAAGEILLEEAGEENVRVELEVWGLPKLPENEYYELWFVEDNERMSGGTFRVEPEDGTTVELTAPITVRSYPEVGITHESDDGDPLPSGEKVLGGNLHSS